MNGTPAAELSYEIGEHERPSEAVVRATAALSDTRIIDLDPLFTVVNPTHLDGVFDDRGVGPGQKGRSMTFTFNGYHVKVTSDEVIVRAPDGVSE